MKNELLSHGARGCRERRSLRRFDLVYNRGKIAIAVCAPFIAKAEVVNLEAEGYERTNP